MHARKWILRFLLMSALGIDALPQAYLALLEYRRLGRPLTQARGLPNTEASFDSTAFEDDVQFRIDMKADKASLRTILNHLDWPATMRTPGAERFRTETGFLLLWRRMASMETIEKLSRECGINPKRVSAICNTMVRHLYDRWGYKLESSLPSDFNTLKRFADVIRRRTGFNNQCVVGYIDCTLKRVSRPVKYQKALYTGYKKIHCLKYQGVVTPDGMLTSLFGPFAGTDTDNDLLEASGIEQQLEQISNEVNACQ